MKLFVTLMVAAGLGFTAAWFTVSNQLTRQHKVRLAARQFVEACFEALGGPDHQALLAA